MRQEYSMELYTDQQGIRLLIVLILTPILSILQGLSVIQLAQNSLDVYADLLHPYWPLLEGFEDTAL